MVTTDASTKNLSLIHIYKIDLRISAPEDVELVIRLPDGLKGEPLVERTKRLESRARPPMEKPIHWQMPVVPV